MRGEAYLRSYLIRGLTRLPDRARRPLSRLAGERDVMITGTPPMSGALLRGLPAEHIQAWEMVRGVVEVPVQEAFRRHVGPGTVVWDVGGNVGYFSLLAARLGGRVHAFEPVPESAARLRGNVAANRLEERIEVHEAAAGATAGRQPFLVVRDASCPTWPTAGATRPRARSATWRSSCTRPTTRSATGSRRPATRWRTSTVPSRRARPARSTSWRDRRADEAYI